MTRTSSAPRRWRACLAVVSCLALAPVSLQAQFQMPDPKQMSGIPRPVSDLPDQSISVRVIRGALANNIANQPVELHVGSTVLKAKTDEAGRAQFDRVTPGSSVTAVAEVDGEHLESQEFPAPAQGGIRLLLVATDTSKGAGTAPAAPNAAAVSGQVVIGGNSRIVIEPADESLAIYYLLDVVNGARSPINASSPFTFEMPAGAAHCGLLDGSSPLASVNGTRVRVQGAFPSGGTRVQVFCELPVLSGSIDLTQQFPAAAERVAVILKRVGDTKLSSPQLASQQELTAQGVSYIAASGPGVAAGTPIVLSIAGLPHYSSTPRLITLSLAAGIVVIGGWAARRGPAESANRQAERRRLIVRRDRLFDDLLRLEQDHRNGHGDGARYVTRREGLLAALEHIYGALDSDDSGPGSFDRAGVVA